MLLTIIAAVIGGFIGYSLGLSQDECPRELQGYNCQGDRCNHSKYEVNKIKREMKK